MSPLFLAFFFFRCSRLARLGPNPPRPPNQNSPRLALASVLDRLVGDGIPHPTGSAANDAVRARILDEFSKLGYAPGSANRIRLRRIWNLRNRE